MGQKVNPIAIRLGITREWVSKWYAGKKLFPQHVITDFRVREFLNSAAGQSAGLFVRADCDQAHHVVAVS